MKKLGDVSGLRAIQTGPFGTQLKAREYESNGRGVPVVSVSEIREGYIRIGENTPRVGTDVQSRLGNFMLDERDVVVSRKGSVDRSAWVSGSYGPLFLGSDAIAVRFSDVTVARFYSYVLQDRLVREWLVRHAPGTTMLSMNGTVLSAAPVPQVSNGQTAAIVEMLGALDDKVAANKLLVERGRDLLLARWHGIVAGRDHMRPLGEVTEINPKVPTSKEPTPAYIEMKRLPEEGLLIDGVERREAKGGVRFLNGDTLLARITPCFENGKMGLVDVLADGEIGYGSTEYIVFRARPGIPRAVPYAVVASESFRTFAARSMTGTSGRQRVQAKGLHEYAVGWPSTADLEKFGMYSDALLARLGVARDENLRLAATREELLPLLMNGKITVKDAEKTVEDVV